MLQPPEIAALVAAYTGGSADAGVGATAVPPLDDDEKVSTNVIPCWCWAYKCHSGSQKMTSRTDTPHSMACSFTVLVSTFTLLLE